MEPGSGLGTRAPNEVEAEDGRLTGEEVRSATEPGRAVLDQARVEESVVRRLQVEPAAAVRGTRGDLAPFHEWIERVVVIDRATEVLGGIRRQHAIGQHGAGAVVVVDRAAMVGGGVRLEGRRVDRQITGIHRDRTAQPGPVVDEPAVVDVDSTAFLGSDRTTVGVGDVADEVAVDHHRNAIGIAAPEGTTV